jgi:hypothetical protein
MPSVKRQITNSKSFFPRMLGVNPVYFQYLFIFETWYLKEQKYNKEKQ